MLIALPLLAGGLALVVYVVYRLLYRLIKSAIKDALREYDIEKTTAAAAKRATDKSEE